MGFDTCSNSTCDSVSFITKETCTYEELEKNIACFEENSAARTELDKSTQKLSLYRKVLKSI